ncbi:D-glycero-beta-D-manno-heptose 1-phosphate adenylyltransferase [Williamwhitmania taraxaci]|uniref:D-glycero-beta-D-manno-heptose 1-phosphate adenylyltransferase n=1 Tax=Williamwhitmania taraxaci TaxID=1640674 RepID=A0A1G6N021_9BACT|nr:D-glycero-beta-D-manno-heptose 1-phosphate adenylyltransferase [Williamwhitmania taraxaci]SDC60485.1 rfaE bifunctional protein, domain II [Williamwhitmania taraxaci]
MEYLEHIKSKIVSLEGLACKRAYWNLKEQPVVFTNGCFDILHRGHIEYLSKAADLGKVMVIGLNSDSSVKRIKGESRPIQDEYTRALVLASLEFVSAVVLFDEDTPYELIKATQPDILVKGADYKHEDIVGYDIVTQRGGSVVTIEFVEGFSTTSIINKLNK